MKSQPVQGDESKIRLTAFGVLLCVITYLLYGGIWIPVFLVIDFGLRSFNLGKFSVLALVAGAVLQLFHWQGKPVYLPPKRFAARIGLLFSVSIFLLHTFHLPAWPVGVVLAFFAALESLFGFCAGCYVYDFLQRYHQKHFLNHK